jgi:hypothetical protein
VSGGGEHTHVGADFGDDYFGSALADSGDGVEAITGRAVVGHQLVDPLIEPDDGLLQVFEMVQR